MMNPSNTQHGDYIMHGMFCSYFTKKLEAYFRAKGIPYQFVEMDGPDLIHCGKKVGIAQLPQVQCPDGSWITDTTPIIQQFEADSAYPTIQPENPLTAFCSYLLEDCFDEWYWAPAMYFRWAFKMDCERRSEEFAYSILSNSLSLPRWLHKLIVIRRQRQVHLEGNGITTAAHAKQIEELYLETLDLLQPILENRKYLFGDRPCEADFGLFGPMFPHFGCDPTPQEIMHVRAPNVFRWLGSMWCTSPTQLKTAQPLTEVPADLTPLMQKLAGEYLPYLEANLNAFQSGASTTRYKINDLEWEVATAPYRVYCLSQLQERFQALSEEDQLKTADFVGAGAIEILRAEVKCPSHMQNITASNPAKNRENKPLGRLWQSDSIFIEKITDYVTGRKTSKSKPEKKAVGADWLPSYFKRFRAH